MRGRDENEDDKVEEGERGRDGKNRLSVVIERGEGV